MLENSIHFLWPILALDKNLISIFSFDGTTPKRTGDLIVIPNLDKTIEKFATEGAKYFTEGDAAKYFLKTYESDLQSLLGTSDLSEYALITSETLSEYSTYWKEPIKVSYRDSEIFLPPAPSQVMIFIFTNSLHNYLYQLCNYHISQGYRQNLL